MNKRYNGIMEMHLKTNKIREDLCFLFCLQEQQSRTALMTKYPNNRLMNEEVFNYLNITNILFLNKEKPIPCENYYESNNSYQEYIGYISDLSNICDTVQFTVSYSCDEEMLIPRLLIDFFDDNLVDFHDNIIGEEEDFEAPDEKDERNITIRGEFSDKNCQFCQKDDKYKKCPNYLRCKNFHNYPNIKKNPIKIGDIIFVKEDGIVKPIKIDYIVTSCEGISYMDFLTGNCILQKDIGKTAFLSAVEAMK